MSGNKVPLFRLYKKQGKNGEYWTGTLGAANVIMFPNKYKETDKDADLVVYAAEKEKTQYPNKGYQPPLKTQGQAPRQNYPQQPQTKRPPDEYKAERPIKNHAPNATQDPNYDSYFGGDPGPEEPPF